MSEQLLNSLFLFVQTLIPVFQNHLQPLLQSFLQRQRAESCTTTSCWTSTPTRRARRCELPCLPSRQNLRPTREQLLLAACHSWAQLATAGTAASWAHSSPAWLSLEETSPKTQPKLCSSPQKKLNDLGLHNGFHTLGWKEERNSCRSSPGRRGQCCYRWCQQECQQKQQQNISYLNACLSRAIIPLSTLRGSL